MSVADGVEAAMIAMPGLPPLQGLRLADPLPFSGDGMLA
jgi:hypothetical protein